MIKETLYNGKKFPDYVFKETVASYLFVEFDFIFDEEFWSIFKRFLEENNIKEIIVENLEPDYPFVERIEVKDLPEKYIKCVKSMTLSGFFADNASLYMITELCLIYTPEDKALFCIVLDRAYDLGIIGFSTLRHADVVGNLDIKDVPDYLTMIFGGKELPNAFKDTLYRNWKLPLLR
jgi:hypothetical protein